MKKTWGSIPESVVYISRGLSEIRVQTWDEQVDETSWEVHKACPAFISDPNNKKTMETGRNWAAGSWRWGSKDKAEVAKVELTVPNAPISDVRILSLERRSQGGRAYKVIVKVEGHDFYVDLREDVLVDTMKSVGIRPGAILNGEFVWGKDGSQTKLIRIGSSLHTDLVAATKQSQKSNLSMTSLVPGRVYAGKTFAALYCGKMSDILLEMPQRKYDWRGVTPDSLSSLTFKRIPATHFWIDIETSEYKDGVIRPLSQERLNSLKMRDVIKTQGACIASRKVTDDVGCVVDFDQREVVKILRARAAQEVKRRKEYLADFFSKPGQEQHVPFPEERIGHGRGRHAAEIYIDNVELGTYVIYSQGQYVQPAQGEPVEVDSVYAELLGYATEK